MFANYKREWSVAVAYLALLLLLGAAAPQFYRLDNARDLLVSNAPVLLVATGMTLVILVGHIDISVGAQFAVASVVTGWLAKAGVPPWLLVFVVAALGAVLGALNGALVAGLEIPSIVVTLAAMVAWRDALRWATEGAWVQNLPGDFQWFGLGQGVGQALIVGAAFGVFLCFAWGLRHLAAGRAAYATGSDAEAARLAGLPTGLMICGAFVVLGVLTGVAAVLNAVRFIDVQSNAGVGLELKAIAAVVVGGTSINGGRGTLIGTLVGVALLGTVGTALTFLGVNAFWEKAMQGAIIIAAVAAEPLFGRVRGKANKTRTA